MGKQKLSEHKNIQEQTGKQTIYKTERYSNIEEKLVIIKREKREEGQFRKLELTYTHCYC